MQYFKLKFENKTPQKLGRFLLKNGFSKRALTNSQHHGGMVLVNHHRRYTSYLLHAGDEVIFILGEEKENKWLKPSSKKLNIVFEQKDYLVINKDAGILSIPSRYEDNDAVVNRLLHYFQQQKQTDLKPHVITRLDRDTSGLVLVGKTQLRMHVLVRWKRMSLLRNIMQLCMEILKKHKDKELLMHPLAK